MVRNRPAGDLAEVLTDLPLEDRILFFRDAAAQRGRRGRSSPFSTGIAGSTD